MEAEVISMQRAPEVNSMQRLCLLKLCNILNQWTPNVSTAMFPNFPKA
jgi:hypothetical protein